MTRKPLTKKTRFEVFKRDSFTCQYCGTQSPTVVLVVDHIKPVAKDGDDDITNLITSCRDCNAGKGARELSDDAVIVKRKKQLDDLQERREQLDMMLEWQRGLTDIEGEATEQVAAYWHELVEPWSLTDIGIKNLRKLLRRFGISEIMECMRIAVEEYVTYSKDAIDEASIQKAWDMVGRIAGARQVQKDKPYMRDLYFIRGIIRNKFAYYNQWKSLASLEEAHVDYGVPIATLRSIALDAKNWTTWQALMHDVCEAYTETEPTEV